MRFQFMLLPAAAVVLPSAAAHAETFLTLEEAQQLMFPGARFTPADFMLDSSERTRLRTVSRTSVFRPKVQMWTVSTGGWFFLDQVMGRDDRITYAVGLDAHGRLKSVEILVCDAEYDQVRKAAWLRAFVGKSFTGRHLMSEIPSLSGATLSSAHVTDGVTRILATFNLFVAPKGGK